MKKAVIDPESRRGRIATAILQVLVDAEQHQDVMLDGALEQGLTVTQLLAAVITERVLELLPECDE